MQGKEKDIHIIPRNREGEQEHIASIMCWCEPEVDMITEDDNILWTHKEVQ